MSLDPVRTTEAITESYLNYLLTTFQLRQADLQNQFREALSAQGRFVKGPILEATPPFEAGNTLETLIRGGVLSPRFRSLRSEALPLDRPLYRHQEEAIRKAVLHGRNIVVATGTGSGKTEAFLVPILNHLFVEEETGGLAAGVRALLLYPMNALANDQMARMRELLKNYPQITFGRYTGETEEKTKDAVGKYRRMYQREPYRNELISRRQMRDGPPHILLTNYAMLEYLLLRPDDHVFFDGQHAGHWRFLVIDEAHVYTGAKGIEMAMLLRRLKDRVVREETRRLQCIITSATLATGEEGFPEVARFAEGLVGEQVEWIQNDPRRQDVVKAIRLPLAELGQGRWKPAPAVYVEWQEIVEGSSGREGISALVAAGKANGIPESVLQDAAETAEDCPAFLYKALQGDERILALRRALAEEPRYLSNMATELFGDAPEARQRLVALVDLATRARPADDHQPLVPARYHLFVRAIEGAYLALRPDRRLFLERRQRVDVGGRQYAVFEIAACRRCGATYLVGEIQEDSRGTTLGQPGRRYYEDVGNLEYYLLLDEETDLVPEDEDETVDYGEPLVYDESDRYKLCAVCGAIERETLLSPLCSCGDRNYVTVVHVPSNDGLGNHPEFARGKRL